MKRLATLKIVDARYSFELRGDWIEVPTEEPGVRTLRLADESIQVAASSLQIRLAPQQLEAFAKQFIGIRVRSETQAASQAGIEQMYIATPQIVRRPWGYTLTYFGSDDRERHFSFLGALNSKGLLNIYGESFAGAQKVSSVMDDIAATLEFDRTSVAPS